MLKLILKHKVKKKKKKIENKAKSLKKEITRKDNIIKNLKMNYENYKQ